jgi:hypothetical protein
LPATIAEAEERGWVRIGADRRVMLDTRHFAERGCFTWMRAWFFDQLLPCEPLAVIQIVAIVARRTDGWEDQDDPEGGRRKETQLSISDLAERLGTRSRGTVHRALTRALDQGYLQLTAAPIGRNASSYGMGLPVMTKKENAPAVRMRNASCPKTGTLPVQNEERFACKKENGSTKVLKPDVNMPKQQQSKPAVVASCKQEDEPAEVKTLIQFGVTRAAAERLVRQAGAEVGRQLGFWKQRDRGRYANIAGAVMTSIRDAWSGPVDREERQENQDRPRTFRVPLEKLIEQQRGVNKDQLEELPAWARKFLIDHPQSAAQYAAEVGG